MFSDLYVHIIWSEKSRAYVNRHEWYQSLILWRESAKKETEEDKSKLYFVQISSSFDTFSFGCFVGCHMLFSNEFIALDSDLSTYVTDICLKFTS